MLNVCLQLDLWYVILNGAVEISYGDGRSEILCMGNSFGITPSLDRQFMNGVVRTRGDDCQVMPAALTNSLSFREMFTLHLSAFKLYSNYQLKEAISPTAQGSQHVHSS